MKKSFEQRPGHTACLLPPMAEKLVGGLFLPGHFTVGELREMSKFRELTNVWGVAAYRVEANAKCKTGNAKCKMEELPVAEMGERFEKESWVMAEGEVGDGIEANAKCKIQNAKCKTAEEGDCVMTVRVIVPQGWAQLAAGMKLMLKEWARGDEVATADYTVVVWPGEEFGCGIYEGENEAVVLGCDDIAVLAELIEKAGAQKYHPYLLQDFWKRRLERAEILGGSVEGWTRALTAGNWLFGVEVDHEGGFPAVDRGQGKGWVLSNELRTRDTRYVSSAGPEVWMARARHVPDVQIDLGFRITSHFRGKRRERHNYELEPLRPPGIPLTFGSYCLTRDVEGAERLLAEYYREVLALRIKHKVLPSFTYFQVQPLIFGSSFSIFFPYIETLSESRSFLESFLHDSRGLIFTDIDQGFELNIYEYDQYFYFHYGNAEDYEDSVYCEKGGIVDQVEKSLNRAQNILRFLRREFVCDLWTPDLLSELYVLARADRLPRWIKGILRP